MKHTNRIRKYFSLTSAAVLSACLLFGCTRADVGSSTQNLSNAGGNATQGTVSATTSDNSLAGAGSGSSSGSQKSPTAQQVAGSTTTNTGKTAQTAEPVTGQTAQNVSGKTTQAASQTAAPSAGTAGAGNTANTQNTDTANAGAANTANPADPAPGAEAGQSAQIPSQQTQPVGGGAAASEALSGEFEKSDGEESVVLSLAGSSQVSFQFRTSGIGASAQAGGNTAVYYGDDGYSITFDVAGDTLAVTVSGEGGSESPMNGIYYRVLDGGDGAIDDGQDDDGEDDVFYADGDAEGDVW